jgi:hypothetical protein
MITAQAALGLWVENSIILPHVPLILTAFLDTNTTTLTNGFNIENNGTNARLSTNKGSSKYHNTLYTTTTDLVKLAIKWNGTTSDIFQNGVRSLLQQSFTLMYGF